MPLEAKLRDAAVKAVGVSPRVYVFRALGTQTYAPTTGATTEGAPVDHNVTGSPPFDYDRALVDGDLVRADDCYIIVPAKGATTTPVRAQRVTDGSTTWTVVNVRPYEGGSQVIAWEVQLRR